MGINGAAYIFSWTKQTAWEAKLYIAKPCKNCTTGNAIIAMATLISRQGCSEA